MIKRVASWTTVLALIVVLLLPALTLEAQGGEPGTPGADPAAMARDGDVEVESDQDDDAADPTDVPDRDDAADPTDVPNRDDDVADPTDVPDPTDEPDRDDDTADPTDVPDRDNDDATDVPSTVEPDDAGDGLSSLVDPPVQAAAASSVESYCDIRDSNFPNQRIVGTFISFRAGYGDPKVTFTLYDLSNTVVGATGASPRPASNPVPAAPVTAAAPNPVRYEWSGEFSKLTVLAEYPSDVPGEPNSDIALTLTCVTIPPTATQAPQPTVDPAFTPPPAADRRELLAGDHDGDEGHRR